MLKHDLIFRNPLNALKHEEKTMLLPGEYGAVLARAGVGKTAFLVQLSLYSLLQNKNVLHISLNEPIRKVTLWYKEVFQSLIHEYQVKHINHLWDAIIPHRFIMSFQVEGFSASKLEERLTDLVEQKIFLPQMIIIDGYPFETSPIDELLRLKSLAETYSAPVWFAVRTHRAETGTPDGIPSSLASAVPYFQFVIQLQPQGDEILVKVLKGMPTQTEYEQLFLDPATMLIKNRT